MKKNRLIKFTLFETISLFFFNLIEVDFFFSNKSKKLKIIYERGKNQLKNEMDILKILKDLRNIIIFKKLLGFKGINKFVI